MDVEEDLWLLQPHKPTHRIPQLIWDTMNAYQRTAALRAAIELDLFTAVGEGKNAADALASACGASTRGIRILCDYLTVAGFLNKKANTYALTATSELFLNRNSPFAMNSTIRFLNSPALMAGFDNLTAVVNRGGTLLDDDGCNAPEYGGWATFAESMMPLMMSAAQFISEEVERTFGDAPLGVLDIAAGHGLFGITLARRFHQAQIVAQDWPNVLPAASRNALAAGVSERFVELPGNAFEVDFGGPIKWCS